MNTQEYLAIKRERIRKRFGDVLPLVNLSPAVVEDLVPLLEHEEADRLEVALSWGNLYYKYECVREERDALQQRVDRLEAVLTKIEAALRSRLGLLGDGRGVDPGAPEGDYTVTQYIDVKQYRKWGEADEVESVRDEDTWNLWLEQEKADKQILADIQKKYFQIKYFLQDGKL
jgi:hypothetical protein